MIAFVIRNWKLIAIALQFLLVLNTSGQGVSLGVFYMTGNSLGVDSSPAITNSVDDYLNGFVQPGIYAFVNYKSDSSSSNFKYLRFDLGVASRTGTFDLGGPNLARITTNSVDLTVLVPMSFPTSRDIEGYAAVGGVLSYQLNRTVVSTSVPTSPVEMKALNPGLALELGFKFGKSAIGYRTMIQFGDFPCRVGAIFFGFCPSLPPRRK